MNIYGSAGPGQEERLAVIILTPDATILHHVLHQLGPVAVIDYDADGQTAHISGAVGQ